jgi:hypothetical protein
MFNVICDCEYSITTDENAYRSYNGVTLNYSAKSLRPGDIEVRPNGFLQLKTIISCEPIVNCDGAQVQLFLKGSGIDASLFDPFAASFFLITRYEEYLAYTPDLFNRFEAASSVLFRNGLLHRPIINEWAEALKQTFLKAHTGLLFNKKHFTCKISIDVDQAFAFRNRGVIKNILALSRNLGGHNMPFVRMQLKTILLGDRDPFDTFDYLKQTQQHTALPFIYFINAGAYTKYDKNISVLSRSSKTLLKSIKAFAEVGLHPSYFSDVMPQKIMLEKKALEESINQPVWQSRQHYLKLNLPQTYQRLIEAGITEDYTMGYASHPGFRAGTCTPFQWFDLKKSEATALTVFPITYMEGSFAEDLAMKPEEALATMKKLTDTVRFYQGCLIPIWHNHTVNDQFFWKGWQQIFEQSIYYIIG